MSRPLEEHDLEERVGSVERSKTHQVRASQMMGFARALPILL
jgi:hypothetical protein